MYHRIICGIAPTRKILCIILIVSFFTCDSLMHEDESYLGKLDTFEDLETAVNGVYGLLNESVYNAKYYCPLYQPNLKGDDLNKLMGGIYETFYWGECWDDECDRQYRPEESNAFLWKNLYQTIASINNILYQFNPETEKNEQIRGILGEVLFLRAYCYFRLTRSFGRIPLIDNINIDYNVRKASFTEIYQFIEKDLTTAADLLPICQSEARLPYQTPVQGTARAFLAEVYLSWAGYPCRDASKYELAAQEAKAVINNADVYGMSLLDDFAKLWKSENKLNPENLFSLFYTDIEDYTSDDSDNFFRYAHIFYGFYNSMAYDFYPEPDLGIRLNFYGTEKQFFNRFPDSYRKDITFFNTIYNPHTYAHIDTGYYHFNTVEGCTRPCFRKFYFDAVKKDFDVEYSGGSAGKDYLYFGMTWVYIFRYASTLLTYAEASARAGQIDELSYECVNRIRRRSYHLDPDLPSEHDLVSGMTAQAFVDSVVWERAWELAGEPEGRWFDLVRLEMVEDLPDLQASDECGPPDHFDKSVYFFPIPEDEILLNPNLGEE